MTATHTPLDSLTYIEASASILDWVSEELDGVHGDAPDLDLAISMLSSLGTLIRSEVDTHGRRTHYSTGHPVHVERHRRRIEPDPDGGPDRLGWVPYVHVCTPGGAVQGDDDGPD